MLRVFIVRIACLSANNASILLKPMILWIRGRLSDLSVSSDTDAYKVRTVHLLQYLCVIGLSCCYYMESVVPCRFIDC